jgi:hypothetical protein
MKKKILKIVFAVLLFCNFNFILHANWALDFLIWSAETFANQCSEQDRLEGNLCREFDFPELVGGIALLSVTGTAIVVTSIGCIGCRRMIRECSRRCRDRRAAVAGSGIEWTETQDHEEAGNPEEAV